MTRQDMGRSALGFLGIGLFLVAWQVIGHFGLAGLTWPPLTQVMAFLMESQRWALFGRAISATLQATAWGYLVGFIFGVGCALIGQLWRPAAPGLERLATVVNAVPSVALGPVCIIFLSREAAPAAIAAIHAGFILYMAAVAGLASASQAHGDLFTALGSSRLRRLWHLEVPVALPALSSGLKLAVPAALIGAVIGEWFGTQRGLGVLIVNAMQNFQIPLLWSAMLLIAGSSLVLYVLLGLLERACHQRYAP